MIFRKINEKVDIMLRPPFWLEGPEIKDCRLSVARSGHIYVAVARIVVELFHVFFHKLGIALILICHIIGYSRIIKRFLSFFDMGDVGFFSIVVVGIIVINLYFCISL